MVQRMCLTVSLIVLSFVMLPTPAWSEARIGCFAFADYAPRTGGIETACSYGARWSVGVLAGAYHPRDLSRFQPDLEAYASFGWQHPSSWSVTLYLGTGGTPGEAWTARSVLVVTNGWRIAPWVNVFTAVAPSNLGVYAQARLGVRFTLSSRFALLPYAEIPFTQLPRNLPLGVMVFTFF